MATKKSSPLLNRVNFVALGFVAALQVHGQSLLGYDPSLKDHPDSFSPGGASVYASSFVVGSNDVVVTSISFMIGSYNQPSSPFQAGAYLYSDAGNVPGTVLGSSQQTLVVSVPQFYTFDLGSPITLLAGSTNWVNFTAPYPGSGPLYIGAAWDLKAFSGNGVTPLLELAQGDYNNPPGNFGVNGTPQTLEYQIAGTAVPEPGTTAFSLVGCGLIFLWRTGKQV